MLIKILGHYAKTPQFRDTLWKIKLKMAQIIARLFGFHGDMAVLCMKFCLYVTQIKSTHHALSIGILNNMCVNIIGELLSP